MVTDADGEPLGFAAIGESHDDDAAGAGEVFAIYLLAGAWGKGYGRALMTGALVRLAGLGYEQATLWVLDTNERARRFYAAAGFRPDGAARDDARLGFVIREVRYRRPLP